VREKSQKKGEKRKRERSARTTKNTAGSLSHPVTARGNRSPSPLNVPAYHYLDPCEKKALRVGNRSHSQKMNSCEHRRSGRKTILPSSKGTPTPNGENSRRQTPEGTGPSVAMCLNAGRHASSLKKERGNPKDHPSTWGRAERKGGNGRSVAGKGAS